MTACYGCRHRRELPGNAHSACAHPAAAPAHKIPLAPLIRARGGALPMPSPIGLNVQFHQHGASMGWASWPINFDPIWLVECDGFSPTVLARPAE